VADERRKRSASRKDGTAQPERDRAEQTLEEWGRRVGRFFASAGARAREEAEDIWAEAQSLRRGERK
jgi:F0F1-type ATP synthase membrane subunit b/b'